MEIKYIKIILTQETGAIDYDSEEMKKMGRNHKTLFVRQKFQDSMIFSMAQNKTFVFLLPPLFLPLKQKTKTKTKYIATDVKQFTGLFTIDTVSFSKFFVDNGYTFQNHRDKMDQCPPNPEEKDLRTL